MTNDIWRTDPAKRRQLLEFLREFRSAFSKSDLGAVRALCSRWGLPGSNADASAFRAALWALDAIVLDQPYAAHWRLIKVQLDELLDAMIRDLDREVAA